VGLQLQALQPEDGFVGRLKMEEMNEEVCLPGQHAFFSDFSRNFLFY
jgi:hypothetical protein